MFCQIMPRAATSTTMGGKANVKRVSLLKVVDKITNPLTTHHFQTEITGNRGKMRLNVSWAHQMKLRGLALHRITGLSSAAHFQFNQRAHFEAVAQKYCHPKESDQQIRQLLENNPEYPEPLAIKKKRIQLEEKIQRDLIKGHKQPASGDMAHYHPKAQMFLDMALI